MIGPELVKDKPVAAEAAQTTAERHQAVEGPAVVCARCGCVPTEEAAARQPGGLDLGRETHRPRRRAALRKEGRVSRSYTAADESLRTQEEEADGGSQWLPLGDEEEEEERLRFGRERLAERNEG